MSSPGVDFAPPSAIRRPFPDRTDEDDVEAACLSRAG